MKRHGATQFGAVTRKVFDAVIQPRQGPIGLKYSQRRAFIVGNAVVEIFPNSRVSYPTGEFNDILITGAKKHGTIPSHINDAVPVLINTRGYGTATRRQDASSATVYESPSRVYGIQPVPTIPLAELITSQWIETNGKKRRKAWLPKGLTSWYRLNTGERATLGTHNVQRYPPSQKANVMKHLREKDFPLLPFLSERQRAQLQLFSVPFIIHNQNSPPMPSHRVLFVLAGQVLNLRRAKPQPQPK